jgi:endonuclease-3
MPPKKPAPAASKRRNAASPGGGEELAAPGKRASRTAVPAKAAGRAGKKPPKPPKPLEPALVTEVLRRFHAAEPEPKGELEHVNPYTLLVAVVLSAQATDAGVNKATRPLFNIADTPQKMLDLGEDAVREAIKTIGLFRNKAKNVIALSRQLVEEHGGEVPQDRAVLETLPGVGRKTANVVLNMAFGQETIAVDTHLFRVSNRIPLAPGDNPLKVELGLEKIVPAPYRLHAHHWLILHGRYVCKARKPECWRCLINDLCRYEPKTPAPKQPATAALFDSDT